MRTKIVRPLLLDYGGKQDAAGSRFLETRLTTIENRRYQQRNVSEFVTQAVEAHFNNKLSPLLVPKP